MSYRHAAAHKCEIVNAPKALVAGQSVTPKKRCNHGLKFEAFVELVDGSFLDIRYHGVAGVSHDPNWNIDNRMERRFAMNTFAAQITPDTIRQLLNTTWLGSLDIDQTRQVLSLALPQN
jgi:hypothetical protein